MKVYQKLEVRGNQPAVSRWVEGATIGAVNEWRRDEQQESRLRGYYCFTREATEDSPEAKVYLVQEPFGLRVANVVPVGQSLSMEQYNAIVRDFRDKIASPAADEAGVKLQLTSDSYRLEEAFPSTVIQKLRLFSNAANKSTGAGHPLDRGRWLEFLVAAHRAGVQVDEGTLARFLEEDLGWSAELAAELAGEYEAGIELLRFNAAQRQDPVSVA
jgi:hypothetical protein